MDKHVISAAKAKADEYALNPAALMAVIEVESSGKVYATVNGKAEPLIRFEGHWFDRRLEGTAKARARLQGLAAERAGAVKNPASQTGRWALLEKAMKIDRQAALESTSWGIGQVMGGHWKWLGYPDIDAMVDEARSGAAGQLSLMLQFIEKSGLVTALKMQDWKHFALAYNGRNALQHGYDRKLREAFERWQEHDFSHTPSASVEDIAKPSRVLKQGAEGEAVTDLQTMLTAHGFPVKITGHFDAPTIIAVRSFQKQAGLAADGIAGDLTMAALAGKQAEKGFWSRLIDWLFSWRQELNRFK